MLENAGLRLCSVCSCLESVSRNPQNCTALVADIFWVSFTTHTPLERAAEGLQTFWNSLLCICFILFLIMLWIENNLSGVVCNGKCEECFWYWFSSGNYCWFFILVFKIQFGPADICSNYFCKIIVFCFQAWPYFAHIGSFVVPSLLSTAYMSYSLLFFLPFCKLRLAPILDWPGMFLGHTSGVFNGFTVLLPMRCIHLFYSFLYICCFFCHDAYQRTL